MLITLSRRTAVCQSVAEVQWTGVVSLGAVSHRFNLILIYRFKCRIGINLVATFVNFLASD